MFGLKLGLPKKSLAEPPPSSDPARSAGAIQGGKSALTVNEFVSRTKRSREKGLEPTKPELIAYARYLGIDPVVDGDLMWISDEALNAPLPCEWTEHHDSADRVFYYNVQSHTSSWTHPLEQLHRDTYKRIVGFRSGNFSKEEQVVELEGLRRECETAEREAHQELQLWTEHTDDQGQKFFYNREQQRSVWTDPRPARCHGLYLQMKALRVLSKHCGQTISARGLDQVVADLKGKPLGGDGVLQNDRVQMSHLFDSNATEGALNSNEKSHSHERSRRKKRRDLEASNKEPAPLHDLVGDAGDLIKKPNFFDLQKPTMAAVEEVRSMFGVSSGLPPHGDGLSTAGRPKVRAGIRLEPLKGGA